MPEPFSPTSATTSPALISSVRSADRIFVLEDGRVVEQGSHDELMARGDRYAELFTLQARAYLGGS